MSTRASQALLSPRSAPIPSDSAPPTARRSGVAGSGGSALAPAALTQAADPTGARLDERARDYCRANAADFSREVNTVVLLLLTRKAPVIFLITIGVGLLNAEKAGGAALLYLLPAATLTILCSLAAWTGLALDTLARTARYYLDLILGVGLLGLSLTWMHVIDRGETPSNGPVQAALIVVGALPFHASFRWICARNVLYAVTVAGVVAATHPSFLLEARGQFLGGLLLGTWIAYYFFKNQQIRFYLESIERRLNLHFLEQMELGFYPHQKEILQTKGQLLETMPLGHKRAVVGEIDVIGSSALQGPTFESGLDEVFAQCYGYMYQNYAMNVGRPQEPYCDGHLHKESGDGFRFTVDHPFPVPPGKQPAAVALDLAEHFIAIFHDGLSSVLGRPAYAAVVLTVDELEGYWSRGPVKTYDFKYSGILRNSRLADARKALMKTCPQRFPAGNLILLEESVWRMLPHERQAELEMLELATMGMTVTGCPDMDRVYYRYVQRKAT
ncbi:MAG: hypothetical protein HYV63_30780 [Candidatus Schekmanbacteria bacterium]|nr:hypothetical protein [Candidatus Schekmanbacteria bacterium]